MIAHNVTFILKSTNFRDDFQIIVKCLHNLIAAKMESSPDDAAVKDMLREWAGEDVEMVLDEMRKLRLIEKVVRGRQITDRMHEIPKSYGKFAGLNVSQKLKIHKMWSLMTDVERNTLLTAAKVAFDDAVNGASASRQYNTHSDEMARVGHLLAYPGATALVTKTRLSMDRATLDATHLGSESSRNDANPYYSLVMDYFNEYDPASDFNLTCYNPVFDHNGQISADNVDSRGLFSNIRSHVRDINPSSFSENLNIRDAEWMKKAIAKFMSTTGNVADKYSRSGNYDAECEYLEWGNFSGGCASWVYYSVLIFSPLVMKQWLPQSNDY